MEQFVGIRTRLCSVNTWKGFSIGQLNLLSGTRKRAGWDSLKNRRSVARLCALYKAYNGHPAWKEINRRLCIPTYISRVDHRHKINLRQQRTVSGNFLLQIERLRNGIDCLQKPLNPFLKAFNSLGN